jgi:diguanylate cyclase
MSMFRQTPRQGRTDKPAPVAVDHDHDPDGTAGMHARRTVVGGVAVLFLWLAVLAVAVDSKAGPRAMVVVDDLLQLGSALAGGLVCVVVAWRTRAGNPARTASGHRTGWLAMGVGLLCWTAGQAWWSWTEIVRDRPAGTPSVADLGYLVFPVGALVAVGTFSRRTSPLVARHRAVLDGVVVALALFIMSWVAVLEPAATRPVGGGVTAVAGLAYPLSDLVVAALAFLLLTRLTASRLPMGLFAAALLAMAVADSGAVVLTATGGYQTGNPVALGWVAAFLLCGLAAWLDTSPTETVGDYTGPGRWSVVLPMIPTALGVASLGVAAWRERLDHVMVITGGLLVVTVLARQLLVLVENGQLVAALHAHEEQRRDTAGKDPLTGLLTRAEFLDRLRAICATPRVGDLGRVGGVGGELTVMVLDIDDFATVNNGLGHAAGDAVLERVGARLLACVRERDLVARTGGAEFLILVADDEISPDRLARRVVQTVEVPVHVPHDTVPLSVTVGLVRTRPEGDPADAAESFLHRADVALRVAQRHRRGSYMVWRPGMHLPRTDDDSRSVRAGDLGIGSYRTWAHDR